jgi:5-oxoprolinase (ATP-hydrolysing) subunit A
VRIELNCDAGEGEGGLVGGQDEALISLVSAVNVACGAHAGDAATIERTIALAVEAGAAIGAHPSYPDRASFGRRHLAMAPGALEASLVEQIEAVLVTASSLGATMRHVKVHGALYNEAAVDAALADAVVRAMAHPPPDPLVL